MLQSISNLRTKKVTRSHACDVFTLRVICFACEPKAKALLVWFQAPSEYRDNQITTDDSAPVRTVSDLTDMAPALEPRKNSAFCSAFACSNNKDEHAHLSLLKARRKM